MRRIGITIGILFLLLVGPLPAQLPPSAIEDFKKAVDLLQAQQFPAALSALQEIRRDHPNNFDILHLSGILLDLNDRLAEANQEFARAVQVNPVSDRARTNLGVSAMRLGRLGEAEEQFQEAFKLNPQNGTAAFNLGALFLQKEQLEVAADWFAKAYQIQPDVYQNAYQLALVNFLLARNEEAGRVLTEMRPRVPPEVLEFQLLDLLNSRALSNGTTPAALTALIDRLSSEPEAAPGVSDLLVSQGLFSEAEQLLTASVAAAPSHESLLRLAEAQLRQGKLEPALESAQKAGEHGRTAGMHLLQGDILEALDRPVEALEQFRMAVSMEPADYTYFSLGYELLAHWNWEEAEAVFKTASSQFPQSWRLWLGLGASLWGQGKGEAATRAFLKAVEQDQNQPMVFDLLSLSFVEAEQSFDDAVQAFQSFQRDEPDNPWALYYRSLAESERDKRLGESADLATLEPWLLQAAEADPVKAPALLLLGDLYFENQDWEKAVGALDRGLALEPDRVEARYKLGLSLQRSGSRERAVQELKKYQELKARQEDEVAERVSRTKKFIIDMKPPE